MSEPLVYVDTSEVREGARAELEVAIAELAAFVEANEPRLLAYNAYLSDDGRRMTVMHVHPDPESLEFHMDVAGPQFRKFADLIELTSIRIYGRPSAKALAQLAEKAELLGAERVVVQEPLAGFSRWA